jgi:hypothetical protein
VKPNDGSKAAPRAYFAVPSSIESAYKNVPANGISADTTDAHAKTLAARALFMGAASRTRVPFEPYVCS